MCLLFHNFARMHIQSVGGESMKDKLVIIENHPIHANSHSCSIHKAITVWLIKELQRVGKGMTSASRQETFTEILD